MHCKGCQREEIVKNGKVRGLQRYKCKSCQLNFIDGDRRYKPQTAAKKALCVLLYSLSKASFNMLGKVLDHSPSIVYRWIKEAIDTTQEPEISGDIKEMEFDEMWHFIQKKVKKSGLSKRWIVVAGEPLPGLQAVVMLQPSSDSTAR
jgi:transposase